MYPLRLPPPFAYVLPFDHPSLSVIYHRIIRRTAFQKLLLNCLTEEEEDESIKKTKKKKNEKNEKEKTRDRKEE